MDWIAFVVINIISVVLCLVRTKHKANYFFSGYLSAMSLGILANIIDPNPVKHAVDRIVLTQLIARLLATVSYWFSPYFLLLAWVGLSGLVPPEKRKEATLVLSLPLLFELALGLIFPKESFVFIYPDYSKAFWLLGLWGSLYVLASNLLACYSVFTEKDAKIRLQKILIAVLTLPTIFVTYLAYIVPIKGSHEFTSYTSELAIFSFVAAAFFAARYSFMGIRIVIGKDFLESSLKSITMGTTMVNHAIKNEVQIIDACVSLLQKKPGDAAQVKALSQITESTKHLVGIINRLNLLTQEIVLVKEDCNLAEVVERVLARCQIAFRAYEITVERRYSVNPVIAIDPVHIQEVVANIINNAIDAMKNGGGRLTVEIYQQRNTVRVAIIDTGCGIAKENLPRVLEPFYTSKGTYGNYGVGLSYCYRVMQKHNGAIEVASDLRRGTVVTLSFPNKTVGSADPAGRFFNEQTDLIDHLR